MRKKISVLLMLIVIIGALIACVACGVKNPPSVDVQIITSLQTSISFDIVTDDVSGILNIDKIELYQGNILVQTAASTDVREFTDLLSDTEYVVTVTYSYDLKDGNGVNTRMVSSIIKKTFAKIAPTVAIKDTTSTQTSIGFDVVTTDDNGILNLDKIELFQGETLVQTAASADVREFTDLSSDTEYVVTVTYSYDLNDGQGVRTVVKSADVKTVECNEPDVQITNLYVTDDSIKADLVLDDRDGIAVLDTVKLTDESGNVASAQKIDFDNLTYGKTYVIEVTYKYRINDGKDEKKLTKSLSVTLDSKTIHQTSCMLDYKETANGTYQITGYSNCQHDEICIPDKINGVSVTSIGASAFKDCKASKIIVGENVSEIEERAFYSCANITEFTIPQNVTSIGSQIFIDCQNLHTVYYNSVASRHYESVLYVPSIKTVIFGDNLTAIPDYVCYNCPNITKVILSVNTKKIGSYAFYSCTGLTQIDLPEGLTYTGFYGFYNSGLTSLILPSTVIDVDCSFRGCYELTSVVIPASLRNIKTESFYVCHKLKVVYYMGNAIEWEAVAIGPQNTELSEADVYLYSEVQPTTDGRFWHFVNGVPTVWDNE